jgi:hypothetical protein
VRLRPTPGWHAERALDELVQLLGAEREDRDGDVVLHVRAPGPMAARTAVDGVLSGLGLGRSSALHVLDARTAPRVRREHDRAVAARR